MQPSLEAERSGCFFPLSAVYVCSAILFHEVKADGDTKLQFVHNFWSELEWRVYSISQLAETTVLTKTVLLNLTGEMTLQLNMNYAIFLMY